MRARMRRRDLLVKFLHTLCQEWHVCPDVYPSPLLVVPTIPCLEYRSSHFAGGVLMVRDFRTALCFGVARVRSRVVLVWWFYFWEIFWMLKFIMWVVLLWYLWFSDKSTLNISPLSQHQYLVFVITTIYFFTLYYVITMTILLIREVLIYWK